MATNSIRTMATPIAAPMTRFLRLSREAASVRKSSSPLAGILPARMKPLREPVSYKEGKKDVERSGGSPRFTGVGEVQNGRGPGRRQPKGRSKNV